VRAGYSSLRQNVREVGLLDERSSCWTTPRTPTSMVPEASAALDEDRARPVPSGHQPAVPRVADRSRSQTMTTASSTPPSTRMLTNHAPASVHGVADDPSPAGAIVGTDLDVDAVQGGLPIFRGLL
jgi:hypothetical protein